MKLALHDRETQRNALRVTRYADRPFVRLGIKALFLVWGAPRGSHRSELMAEYLGMDLQRIYITTKQGRFYAPFKYVYQCIATWVWLVRHRYQVIFVQDPPIIAALAVYIYSLFSSARFVIDSHTDALQASWWQWSLPLHRYLERRAITTVVTNDLLQKMLEGWGSRSLTLADPPGRFTIGTPVVLAGHALNLVMVSTADYDEPVAEVLEAARKLPDIGFYITGDFHSMHHRGLIDQAPPNVYFTGYLREGYFALLDAADLVLCLTTEDNTFLSGDNEALWLGKPLITSDWPVLRHYFSKGTLHIGNTAEEIYQAITTVRDHLPLFQAGIRELQQERRREWELNSQALVRLADQAVSGDSERDRPRAERKHPRHEDSRRAR